MPTFQLLPFTDPWLYALMAALILGSAFMQGVGGVGFTMFAAPAAAILAPELVPGPLLMLGSCVTFLTAAREHRCIAWEATRSALAGRALGTIVAVFALAQLTQRPLNFLFAAMILLAVGLSIAGLRIAATRTNVGIAGVLSGVMGTLTSVGAPPLVIALHSSAPATLRATTGAILFFGSTFSLLLLALTGHYGLHEFLLGATLVPFMLLGFRLSGRMRQKVGAVALRRGLLAFCALSAFGLILKTL